MDNQVIDPENKLHYESGFDYSIEEKVVIIKESITPRDSRAKGASPNYFFQNVTFTGRGVGHFDFTKVHVKMSLQTTLFDTVAIQKKVGTF